MHVPEKWRLVEQSDIFAFIEKHSFATIVSPSLQSSHLPLMLDASNRCLIGHFARNNPHWREFQHDALQQHLVIFNGPHGYISPTWYDNKPAVPTWNYAAVHIKGCAEILSGNETIQAIEMLMLKHEPELLVKRDVVTADYQEKLSKGIVGFKISIDVIDAKAKLGQHRSIADQQGVTAALSQSSSAEHQALLEYMHEFKLGIGEPAKL
ncbi:FMN-binding negative transcriptional regulator [Colwellia sp. C1TZA3]|uniref:FMN-binding negative transcriptional regulator n=1 Tax=Colwellia sp. C1TZA3 TaxID=2508879 RepID=UPI0011B9869D|nr:FMN-binding negative transcriptional regulator [Colwellia sp. C1TZA3]TWX69254.1 FMN-binding negative transcriptional regulator [Colwellia sp. C1TZA3]